MGKENKDRPRQQYYDFAHFVLPEIFFRNPEAVMNSIKKEQNLFLNYLWEKVGEHSKEKYRMDFNVELEENSDNELVIIYLPEPEHDHEAFAIGLIKNLDFRYFIFELRMQGGEPRFIVGEWIKDNYSELTELKSTDVSGFVNYIKAII